jgi:hypothetical protein
MKCVTTMIRIDEDATLANVWLQLESNLFGKCTPTQEMSDLLRSVFMAGAGAVFAIALGPGMDDSSIRRTHIKLRRLYQELRAMGEQANTRLDTPDAIVGFNPETALALAEAQRELEDQKDRRRRL